MEPTPQYQPQPPVTPPLQPAPTPPEPVHAVTPAPVAPPSSPTPPLQPISQPVAPTQPIPPVPAPTPTIVSGDGGFGDMYNTGTPAFVPGPPPASNRRFPKPVLLGVIGAVLLVGGASAFYLGYYKNPTVMYAQSLSRTGKGYDKLIDAADSVNTAKYNGYAGTGTFKFTSKSFSTDGSLKFNGDDKNAEAHLDVGLATSRPNLDARFIDSVSDSPDIYLKFTNIKGLATMFGADDYATQIDSLDGSWVAIDHTLIDSYAQEAVSQASTTIEPPSKAQIIDEARAFGTVNNKYLFSTNKNVAVTTVTKKIGAETIDGHKTYHYKVALNKANVKKYITAQKDALLASKLGSWVKQHDYQNTVNDAATQAVKSADDIKASDTYDIWIDTGQRIVYKIRFLDTTVKNPAENYIDVGMAYQGGDELPFFVSGQTKTDGSVSTGSLKATFNTKTYETKFDANLKFGGSDAGSFTMNLTYKPGNNPVKVEKPATSKSLSEVSQLLGLGDIAIPGTSQAAEDTKRQVDVNSMETQLEGYYAENGYYPSRAQMNDPIWRAKNMKDFDDTAMQDPSGSTKTLTASPAAKVYAYAPLNLAGASCEADATTCSTYTLTATRNDGTTYQKANLN